MPLATNQFTGTASITCSAGKKLKYQVKIDTAFGEPNVYINRGIDPVGSSVAIGTGGLVGYAGLGATVDVRTDGSEIKQIFAPIRFANVVTISSDHFEDDLNSWIDEVGRQIADLRLGKSKSVATPEGIADLAAANRLRMRLHLLNGDIIFDLNQTGPEPTAVLAMCGLGRSTLTKALNAKAAEKIESERQFEEQQRQIQQQAPEENEQ